jgi:hypothetical protein
MSSYIWYNALALCNYLATAELYQVAAPNRRILPRKCMQMTKMENII